MSLAVQVFLLSVMAVLVVLYWPHMTGVLFSIHICILAVCLWRLAIESRRLWTGWRAASWHAAYDRGYREVAARLLNEQPESIVIEKINDRYSAFGKSDAYAKGAEDAIDAFKKRMSEK